MPDLVVKDLSDLVRNLDELVIQFKDAVRLQDDQKGQWGQLNANLSMGDFADNWKVRRGKIVDAMKKFRDQVEKVDEAWTEAEQKLTASLEQK